MADQARPPTPVIEVRGLATRFGDHMVHQDLDLTVNRAEIFALVGGSGSGKSTLLREIILLHRPDGGSIKLTGHRPRQCRWRRTAASPRNCASAWA